MDKLHVEITRKIYEYDSTCRHVFNKALIQLRYNFFIYRCHICCRKWNDCFCWCLVCRTYLRLCHQLYYDENSMLEDELPDVIQLGI